MDFLLVLGVTYTWSFERFLRTRFLHFLTSFQGVFVCKLFRVRFKRFRRTTLLTFESFSIPHKSASLFAGTSGLACLPKECTCRQTDLPHNRHSSDKFRGKSTWGRGNSRHGQYTIPKRERSIRDWPFARSHWSSESKNRTAVYLSKWRSTWGVLLSQLVLGTSVVSCWHSARKSA